MDLIKALTASGFVPVGGNDDLVICVGLNALELEAVRAREAFQMLYDRRECSDSWTLSDDIALTEALARARAARQRAIRGTAPERSTMSQPYVLTEYRICALDGAGDTVHYRAEVGRYALCTWGTIQYAEAQLAYFLSLSSEAKLNYLYRRAFRLAVAEEECPDCGHTSRADCGHTSRADDGGCDARDGNTKLRVCACRSSYHRLPV